MDKGRFQEQLVWAIAVVSVGVIIYNHFFLELTAGPGIREYTLQDMHKEVIAHLREMTKLMISLALGIIGLLGYFSTRGGSASFALDQRTKIPLVLAFCMAMLSIDFGYIFMEKWVEIMTLGVFDPYDNLVHIPYQLQIGTFILSLISLGAMLLMGNVNQRNGQSGDDEG